MKIIILIGIALLLFSGILTKVCWGQVAKSTNDSCSFSKYKRLKEPHTLYDASVKKVYPEYPPAANRVRAGGKVVVRILVNKKGEVVDACAIEGHPLLRAASVDAAKQWKFKKNFGFVNHKPKEQFAEIDLIFNFKFPE